MAILEVRNAEMEKRILDMQEALLRAEAREAEGSDAAPAPAPDPAPEEIRRKSISLLRVAADKLALEASDPGEVRQIMYSLVTLGPASAQALREVAADTAAGALRIPAVLTMAFSRDTSHSRALQSLCADKDPVIRREALTALTKVDPRAALDDARRLLSDPDETVAMAAGEAYRILGNKSDTQAASKASSKPAAEAATASATPKAAVPAPAKAVRKPASKAASKAAAGKPAKPGIRPSAKH